MSPDNLSRVACLRIPHFQIAVLERSGQVRKGGRCVLVSGLGDTPRVVAQSLSAHQCGIQVGMLLSRAVMVASDLKIMRIEESPVSQVTKHLTARLQHATPRISSTDIGCFWLEPFSVGEDGEHTFASRVFELLREEGFDDARMGVADTVVASNALSLLVGAYTWSGVRPGGDAAFLAPLSLDYLPIGQRLRTLLEGVGVYTIQDLQSLSIESIQRRFGSAGLRAWKLAWANDPRGPRTPTNALARKLDVSFWEPTRCVETILFILGEKIEHLSRALSRAHRAATRLTLGFKGDGGEECALTIGISPPTHDAIFLFARIQHHLRDGGLPNWSGADIESVTMAVTEDVPFTPKQHDLWSATSPAARLSEGVAIEMEKVLGGVVFVEPVLNDSQKPEEQGRWVRRTDSDTRPPVRVSPDTTHGVETIAACMKMLESPLNLRTRGEGFFPSEIFASALNGLGWIRIFHWHGPEKLCGEWWSKLYQRDYYWAVSEEQYAVWLFYDRFDSGWFIHGWLD